LKGLKTAKTKAWKNFSIFIRTRDCIENNDSLESGLCYTCEKPYDIKRLQCGHFLPGRNNKVLFDEEQTHSQCYHCNIGLSGNWPEYLKKMVRELGQDKVDQMLNTHKEVVKYTQEDYEQIAKKYKDKYEQLVQEYKLNH